jgi:tripartite ATP-independent transporter DctP family solute receptor
MDLAEEGIGSSLAAAPRLASDTYKETKMHVISRRRAIATLAAGAVSTPLSPPLFAQGKPELKLKMGLVSPPDLPLTKRSVEAAQRIGTESNGRVSIEIFPNGQLGSDGDMLSQVRSGALDFVGISALSLSAMVPAAAISGMGFAWSGYDTLWPALDGELGNYIRSKISASGLQVMDKVWDNGFRQVTTSGKQVKTPADMKALKIRVVPSPLLLSVFQSLGASPVSLAWPEVYSALQTRIVDGQENSIPVLYFNKLYEVQKQVVMTSHVWDGFWILGSKQTWAKLSPELRTLVASQFDRSAVDQRKDIATQSKTLTNELVAKGMTISQIDRTAFREHLKAAGFYATWRKTFGDEAWLLLEKYAGDVS